MNRRFFSAFVCAFLMLAMAVQAQQRLIVTSVTGNAEYINKGHKYPLSKGSTLDKETMVYIPYNGSLTLIDEASNKEYTIKTIGWAAVEEKLAASSHNVLTRTKDYVKSVLAEVRKAPIVKARYVSDPATVTREKYVKKDSKERDLRAEFDAFSKGARRDYDDFRKKCLEDYAKFVREAWQQFKPEKPVPVPEEEEVMPVLAPDADAETASWFGNQLKKLFKRKNKDKALADKGSGEKKPVDTPKPVVKPKPVEKQNVQLTYEKVLPPPPVVKQPEPLSEVHEQQESSNDYMAFDLFGTKCRVRIGDNCRFSLPSVNENDVADAITKFSQTQFDNMLYDCLQERKNHSLSDWAYYQMLLALTNHFYGENSNEATLALAFLYSQSGYKMRLAQDGTKLYMLVASDYMLYNKSFFYIDNESYFLLEGNKDGSLKICKAGFPKESTLSLQISAVQEFSPNPTVERTITSRRYSDFSFTIKSNKNYIDFYETYPSSSINNNFMTRWAMYANTPMDKGLEEQLYPQMREKLAGMSKLEAVQHLLNWVQTGLEYEYDDNVWGQDRAFFGEESLFYPYCDCEDRSILLSHLVRDLVGLDVVLVYYPGHLAMAVDFKEDIDGDYYMYDNRKFTVCDPTYIGASVGQAAMEPTGITLILLDSNYKKL